MCKITLLLALCILIAYNGQAQNVAIGTTTPATSARLDVSSTNSGFLPPRMTTTQRNAIASPVPGLVIFNTDSQGLEVYTTNGWIYIKNSTPIGEKLIGGAGYDIVNYIPGNTTGEVFLAGTSQSSISGDITATNHGNNDCLLIKLDVSGRIMWNKLLGGNNFEILNETISTSDQGLLMTAQSHSSQNGDVVRLNHGNGDAWIVKLNSAGDTAWTRLMGGNQLEIPIAVDQSADGGYILGAYSASSQNGDVVRINHGSGDVWVVKLNSSGDTSWTRLYGGNQYEEVRSIKATTDGGSIFASYSSSSQNGDVVRTNHGLRDVWVVKLNSSGDTAWTRLFGGNQDDNINKLIQTSDGGYLFTATTFSSQSGDVLRTNHGSSDIWVVKLTAAGDTSWTRLLGGNSSEATADIQQTADGGYIISAYSTSSMNGDVTSTNHGSTDIWIVKLNPSGDISWTRLLGSTGSEAQGQTRIRQLPGGDYLVAACTDSGLNGDIFGINHGGNDIWIFKLDANGIIQQ